MEKEPFLFDHEETLKDIHNLSLEAHRLLKVRCLAPAKKLDNEALNEQ